MACKGVIIVKGVTVPGVILKDLIGNLVASNSLTDIGVMGEGTGNSPTDSVISIGSITSDSAMSKGFLLR
jgi:hypothetical protein